MRDREYLTKYWRNPDDGRNLPEQFVSPAASLRTNFLVKIIIDCYCSTEDSILEIGCNAGRNLKGLHENGYTDITGVELSSKAIDKMEEVYPEIMKDVNIFCMDIEDFIAINTRKFDCIFTMAVLCHIHPDIEEKVFSWMIDNAQKYIILIEDEKSQGQRHQPRDYSNIFGKDFIELQNRSMKEKEGLPEAYTLKVFKKK